LSLTLAHKWPPGLCALSSQYIQRPGTSIMAVGAV
jgi:hypothetical protein